ncbi:MAG: hypothetical protein ABH864_00750 [archaeon]
MKRRLIKQGGGGFTIYLPRGWTRKFNIEKGDEVDVEEIDQNLIIRLEENVKKEKKVTLDVSGYGLLVNRVIMALYMKGVDELEVTFTNPDELVDFQKRVINELIGFEIIKQTQNSMVIKDIAGSETHEINDLVRRIFFILDSMAEEFVIALEKKQKMKPIIEIDSSVNKFSNFCLRILNKKGDRDFSKTPHIYGIVSLLEETGDIYKKIALEVQNKAKITKEQIESIKETRKSLALFKEVLFDFEKEKIVKFAKKYEEIKRKIKDENKIDFYLLQLNDTIIKMNNYLLVFSL